MKEKLKLAIDSESVNIYIDIDESAAKTRATKRPSSAMRWDFPAGFCLRKQRS